MYPLYFSDDIDPKLFSIDGACLIFTVWHINRVLANEFLGEFIIRLSDIGRVDPDTLSGAALLNAPAMIINLKKHAQPSGGGYQVRR